MKFPLPVGHKYGYAPDDVTVHDGFEDYDYEDRVAIGAWQRRVNLTRDRDVVITYRYDGPTQRAAIAVQRAHGLPLTGMITQDTWDAVWASPVTPPETPLKSAWSALEGSVPTQVPPKPQEPSEPVARPREPAPSARRPRGRPRKLDTKPAST